MPDFQITKGDTPTFNVAVTQGGSVFSLVGCSMWFTAKYAYRDLDAAAVFQKTIGAGITVTNAALGLATVTLAAIDTSPLAAVKVLLVWDLQVRTAGGKTYTVSSGNLIVFPDVTLA